MSASAALPIVDGMRRQDIQLLASARQGDNAARLEVARRYLLGAEGFPRHVATGLEYLAHASTRELPQAATLIAESLPLPELLRRGHDSALDRAAAHSALARAKRAAWHVTANGAPPAEVRRALATCGEADAAAVALIAAERALPNAEMERIGACLRNAIELRAELTAELAALVVEAVRLAEARGVPLRGLDAEHLLAALEQRADRGDRDAAYSFGRGLCGIASSALPPWVFADKLNLRKGAAFLLRAADAGVDAAWLHLYRLCADHRLSIANPEMARFFLEKAAERGQPEAERKLGALLLREASSLAASEQAIQWLHRAAAQGDAPAHELLRSLVLPVPGAADVAAAAIEQVRRSDPWLALRLELARQFGLTKLEALCVDPVDGLRPWGLVVGRNPFITQQRLSAPRAVPALSPAALDAARRAATWFSEAQRDRAVVEGDLRRRSLRQRRLFERLDLDDTLFFAEATSMRLEALRLGPKWAFRARQSLSLALAA
jgi:TPR repeat protein